MSGNGPQYPAVSAIPVGLIVPPASGAMPPDVAAMYPDLRFEVVGLGLPEMSEAGYSQAVGRVTECSAELAARGVSAVFMYGTSLSFFRGAAYNGELEEMMAEAAGVPATTLTSALTGAMRGMGMRRLAVATAYTDEVNRLFRAYFESEGFEIASLNGMNIAAITGVDDVGDDAIAALAGKSLDAAPDADGIVISCAGLVTAGVAPKLESRFGLPVLSSSMVGAWAAARLGGHSGAAPGMGRLYET